MDDTPVGPRRHTAMIDPRWPADDHFGLAVRILLGASLGMLCGAGPVLFHSSGVFVSPIADDTGWSRELIAGAFGLTSIVFGFMSPVTGFLADRFRPRAFALVSMPMLGAGVALLGLVPGSAEMFVVMILVAALLGSGQMPHAYTLGTAKWFDRRRGLALGIVLSCTGLSLALMAPFASSLITAFGWRMAYVCIGGTVAVLGLITAFLIVDPPKNSGKAVYSSGMSLGEAVRSGRFWLMFGSFFLISLAVAGGILHLPGIAAAKNIDAAFIATTLSIVGISAVITRVSFGYLLDVFFAPRISALVFLAPAIGYALVLSGEGAISVFVGAFLLGVGLGAETDALSYIATRAFGMANYGKVFGLLFFAIGLGGGVAPYLFARMAAAFDGYVQAMVLGCVLSVISAGLIVLLSQKDLPFRSDHAR